MGKDIKTIKEFAKIMNDLFGFLSGAPIRAEKEISDKEKLNILQSLSYWLLHKKRSKERVEGVHVGEVYMFSFGLNALPCISYVDMGVIIAKDDSYIYVMPITTYTKRNHKNAYHPSRDNDINNEFHLMKKEEFDFLDHDSVIKPTDVRCLTALDICFSKPNGKIDTNSEFFENIMDVFFHFIHNDKAYQIKQMNNKFIKLLNNELTVDKIHAHQHEQVSINKFIRGSYGSLKNDISIDTSKVGEFTYEIAFVDDFDNEAVKSLTVVVEGAMNKAVCDITEELVGAK